jgi:hypothetical protein
MIDWVDLGFNALWILGLAILLAAFSYQRWLAYECGRSLRAVLSQRSWRLTFTGGMLLVCGGVAGGIVERWWERMIWTALGTVFGYRLVLVLRRPDKRAHP